MKRRVRNGETTKQTKCTRCTATSLYSETNAASQSVIEEQISDTVAEGTIDVKLGKESQEKA